MNIIHMDLRVHRGFEGQVREKGRFQRERNARNAKKKPPEWGQRLGRVRGAEILAEVTGERAEGVG
jgi:hypothetical protein